MVYPHKWLLVTHQLQVRCRPGKVHRPDTDVVPLSYTTNVNMGGVWSINHTFMVVHEKRKGTFVYLFGVLWSWLIPLLCGLEFRTWRWLMGSRNIKALWWVWTALILVLCLMDLGYAFTGWCMLYGVCVCVCVDFWNNLKFKKADVCRMLALLG